MAAGLEVPSPRGSHPPSAPPLSPGLRLSKCPLFHTAAKVYFGAHQSRDEAVRSCRQRAFVSHSSLPTPPPTPPHPKPPPWGPPYPIPAPGLPLSPPITLWTPPLPPVGYIAAALPAAPGTWWAHAPQRSGGPPWLSPFPPPPPTLRWASAPMGASRGEGHPGGAEAAVGAAPPPRPPPQRDPPGPLPGAGGRCAHLQPLRKG